MSALDAAKTVLAEAEKPLHYREITRLIMERGLWTTAGKTPEATVNALLAVEINKKGGNSKFQRTGRGVFALRAWGLHESVDKKAKASLTATSGGKSQPPKQAKTLSFTDAAERVLKQFGNKQPMHYLAITEKALESGLIATIGKTPEATLYASILSEIRRKTRRGEQPRFAKHGRGLLGLTQWMVKGLAFQIQNHNKTIRKKLHERIRHTDPAEFEALTSQLLIALGFEEVSVTGRSGDGGIDVRGTLVVGDVIRTRMAVQAKCWKKQNVQAPTIQQVRGSLGAHEQGLVITTSGFSKGARDEAERLDATPVALMDGEQLVKLLMENDIGVQRTICELFELGKAQDEDVDLVSPALPADSGGDQSESKEPKPTTKRGRRAISFPSYEATEVALLRAIIRRGGSIVLKQHGKEINAELAKESGLTEKQLSQMVARGQNAWSNRIRWTRQALVASGDMDGSQRGVWTVTQKGRQRAGTGD